ncbi:MAG: hypothetical protein P0S95_01885 [Rhabdochlamydiaceae bacterium]|nr:hypothetical protein [Candidatus Amphrikana amoebophyrae]
MQVEISEKERRVYRDNQGIELFELISEKDFDKMRSEVDNWRLEKSHEEQWKLGRDLFQQLPSLKKILTKKSFVSVASQLSFKSTLRLAMSQLLGPLEPSKSLPTYYSEALPFSEHYCYQGLTIAMMICLEPSETELEYPFPNTSGSVYFFPVTKEFSMKPLINLKSGLFMLSAFGEQSVLYIEQPNDPLVNKLKKEGYGFGDNLKNDSHPLFFL